MNLLTKATAVTLGAATLVATAAPADAQRYRDRYHRHHDRTGTAIVAGVAGLAIGAALASSSRDRYYDRGYYDRDYYYDGPRYRYRTRYYYDRPYYRGYRGYRGHRDCYTRRVWDPYIGRRVRVRYCR